MKTQTVSGMTYHVHSNYQTREIVHAYQLTDKQFSYVDYLERDDSERDLVIYLGSVYDLSEFEIGHNIMALGFNAWHTDSYWSATVVRYFDEDGNLIDHGESVVMGRIHW